MNKTPPSILAVLFRCSGIFVLLYAIKALPQLAPVFQSGLPDAQLRIVLLLASVPVFLVIFGVLLISCARPLAKMVGGNQLQEGTPDLLLAGIQLIGVYCTIKAIGDTAHHVALIKWQFEHSSLNRFQDTRAFPASIGVLAELIAGLILLLRSRSVAHWFRFRVEGVQQDSAPNP